MNDGQLSQTWKPEMTEIWLTAGVAVVVTCTAVVVIVVVTVYD